MPATSIRRSPVSCDRWSVRSIARASTKSCPRVRTSLRRCWPSTSCRSLQSQWNDLESRSKEGAPSLSLRSTAWAKGARAREAQVMLEEKGLFVGDLGEQRRHMQDVVGRINSDMRLLEEKGHNMVSRLSDMRGRFRAPNISVVAWSRSSRMRVPA
ncbi:MAG: hypothetical protein ACLTYW_02200 [Collinsella sp.]